MEKNIEISIPQILKEALKILKNTEILIVTMTFVLLGTALTALYDPIDSFTIKKLIFYVLAQCILLIGQMTIIKIVEKKYKKEEVDLKNIIKELIPRTFSALGLELIVVILCLVGLIAVIIPGVLFMIYSAFYLQIFTLENNGIKDSIGKSIKFINGFIGYIFKMLMIIITIAVINEYALLELSNYLFNSSTSWGINIIISTLINSFTTIASTSLYLKVKKIKTLE